jgi:hypothetical protein
MGTCLAAFALSRSRRLSPNAIGKCMFCWHLAWLYAFAFAQAECGAAAAAAGGCCSAVNMLSEHLSMYNNGMQCCSIHFCN